MKLTTNFTAPIRKVLLALFLLSITTSISALAFVYYLGAERGELMNESRKLKEILSALSDKHMEADSQSQQMIAPSEALSVRERITQLNSLTPTKGANVNYLLGTIERIIPKGVTIYRLGYSAIDGRLTLVAESNEPDRIYLFMKQLEQDPLFEAPLLQQQPGIGNDSISMPHYEIHVVARKI